MMIIVKGEDMDKTKKRAKCDVCKNYILIDGFGNGENCPICGWKQSEESFYHKDVAGIRNIPCLNNAIKQYKEGKSAILANFSDFVMAYKNYGEVEFTYNNTRYGVYFDDKHKKVAMESLKDNVTQYFESIEDFADNAMINGVNLKSLWQFVTDTDFLQ